MRPGNSLHIIIALGAIFCSLCAAPAMLRAQGDILIGPVFGYEFGVPLDLDRSPGVINRYKFSGSGESVNHAVWGGMQILSPQLMGERWGVMARFGFVVSEGNFTSVPFTAYAQNSSTGDSLLSVQEFKVRSLSELFQIDLRATFQVMKGWGIECGPWGSFRTATQLRQIETIIGPEEAVYPGNIRGRTVAQGDSIASSHFRYGLGFGSSFHIAIDNFLTVRPDLYTRLDIGALAQGAAFRSFSAGLGVAVLFDPDHPDFPDPPPITAQTDTAATRAPLLQASIDLYVVGPDGERPATAALHSRNTLHRHYMPLLPVLYFEPGSAELPERYTKLTSDEAGNFSRRSLVQLDAVALYHQTLNIIGWRLRSEPAARVTLHGSAAGDEPSSLAGSRADGVAEYLRRVWGIEPGRIEVRSGRPPYDLGAGSERSVQFVSTSDRLMAPVVAEWVERERFAPQLGLARSIRSELGVEQWGITLRQGNHVVARYSSTDDEPFSGLDGAFLLDAAEHDSAAPIEAEFEVTDIAGHRTVVLDHLPVAAGEGAGGSEIAQEVLTFTFAGLGRDFPVLARGNATLMGRIPGIIREGGRVTVLDKYAGTAGQWGAGGVAEQVLAALKKEGKRVEELRVVSGELHGDNNSGRYPEWGLLGAGAGVVVEQSIKGDGPRRP